MNREGEGEGEMICGESISFYGFKVNVLHLPLCRTHWHENNNSNTKPRTKVLLKGDNERYTPCLGRSMKPSKVKEEVEKNKWKNL